MKKFIGYVNGKSFENEEDFNKAADEAIKNNDGSLAITSYYKYSNDGDGSEGAVNTKADDKFVSTHEYFLGTRQPDSITKDSVVYNVPDELKKKLAEASNIKDIKKCIDFHVGKLEDNIKIYSQKVSEYQETIEKYQNELYKFCDALKDEEGRKKYYNTLNDVVVDALNKREAEAKEKDDPKNVDEKNQFTKDSIKEFLGIDTDMSLYSFLKQVGILR